MLIFISINDYIEKFNAQNVSQETFAQFVLSEVLGMLINSCEKVPVTAVFSYEENSDSGVSFDVKEFQSTPTANSSNDSDLYMIVRHVMEVVSPLHPTNAYMLHAVYPMAKFGSFISCVQQRQDPIVHYIFTRCKELLGALFVALSYTATPLPLIQRVDPFTWTGEAVFDTLFNSTDMQVILKSHAEIESAVHVINAAVDTCIYHILESVSIGNSTAVCAFPSVEFSVDSSSVFGCLFEDQSAMISENFVDVEWYSDKDKYIRVCDLIASLKLTSSEFPIEKIRDNLQWRRVFAKLISKKIEHATSMFSDSIFILHESELRLDNEHTRRKTKRKLREGPSSLEMLSFASTVRSKQSLWDIAEKRNRSDNLLEIRDDDEVLGDDKENTNVDTEGENDVSCAFRVEANECDRLESLLKDVLAETSKPLLLFESATVCKELKANTTAQLLALCKEERKQMDALMECINIDY